MQQKEAQPRLIQAMRDAFSLPDLRQRLLFTLGILVAWMYWPLWIGWGFYRKWKMRKDRAEGRVGDQRG